MSLPRLRLYITGRTAHAIRAVENLRDLCENELVSTYELEVIDVLDNPERAEEANILATPVLVREAPLPVVKLVGDLSDRGQVLVALGLG